MSTITTSKKKATCLRPHMPPVPELTGLHDEYPISISKKTGEINNKESESIKLSTADNNKIKIPLDKITQEEMEANNEIIPYIFKLNFPANHRLHGFGFTRAGQSITFSGFITIEVMFDDLNVSITLDQRLVKEIISDVVPVEKFFCLPELLQIAIIEVALDDCFDGAEKALDAKMSIHSVSLTAITNSNAWVFSVLKNDDVRGFFSITKNEKIDKYIRNSLVEKKENLNNVERTTEPSWVGFRIPVRFELASVRLTQKEVTSLYVGDVVVIDQIKPKINREIKVLIGENYFAYGSWQKHRVKVTKKLEIEMGMLEQQQKNVNYNKEVRTEDLQIRLSFDAGSTNVDLKTLKKLRTGYTFMLDKNYKNLINIRSEGDCIAVGELVEIGDCIGVRIVEFAHGGN